MHNELKGNTGWLYMTLTHLQNYPRKCVLQTVINFVQHNVEVPKFWLFWLSHTWFVTCPIGDVKHIRATTNHIPNTGTLVLNPLHSLLGCVKEGIYTHPSHYCSVFKELKICIQGVSEYTEIKMLPSVCNGTDYCFDMCQITNGFHTEI